MAELICRDAISIILPQQSVNAAAESILRHALGGSLTAMLAQRYSHRIGIEHLKTWKEAIKLPRQSPILILCGIRLNINYPIFSTQLVQHQRS